MSTHLDVAALATGRSVNDIVRVQGLHKRFGGPAVLEDVSFSLCTGQVHSVIGPNGAGKTTLLNVLSGLYQPSAGEVFIAGRSLARLPPHHLAKLGVARTFQNLKIARNLTIEENVLLGAHVRARAGIWAGIFRPPELVRRDSDLSVRARELLKMVGVEVDPHTMPDALSYGALKRLEIARALMAEPRLLLLDEPAAGLNQRETVEIGQLIKRLTEHNITVVLIEHDMKLVMGISDQVIVLNYGRKIAQGTPDFVVRDPEVVKAYLGTNH